MKRSAGMKDLFGDEPAAYPERPGFKEGTTSRDAARAIEPGVGNGRERVFAAIADSGRVGSTADEAAGAVSRSVLYVRPRVAELARSGRIVDTGQRRANDTGLKAKVWRAR